MRLTKISCPHCEAALKNPTGIPVGKKIVCPKCREPFVVTTPDEEEEEHVQAKPSSSIPARKAKRPVQEVDEDERDEDAEDQEREAPPRKKKNKKKGKKQQQKAVNLLPFLILGGCLLLAGVGTGLYFLLHKKSAESPPSADNRRTPVLPGTQLPSEGGNPTINIELSEPRAEVILHMDGKRILFFIDAKIKYRFPEGVPSAPGKVMVWAKCDEGAGMITLGETGPLGNLKPEGEAHTTMLLRKATESPEVLQVKDGMITAVRPKKALVSKEVVFQAAFEAMGGGFRDTGKSVSCEVKMKDSYLVP